MDESLSRLNDPTLVFSEDKVSVDPIEAFAVRGFKPYHTPNGLTRATLHVLAPRGRTDDRNVKSLFSELEKGVGNTPYPRARFLGFEKSLGIRLNWEMSYYKNLDDVKSYINKMHDEHDKQRVVAVISRERSERGGFYYALKVHSIQSEVQTQVLLSDTVTTYARPGYQRGDFLWNLALSIASKLGVRPWRLEHRLFGVAAFIALSTTTRSEFGITRRTGVAALELVNSWGEHLGRVFTSTDVTRDEERPREKVIDPSVVTSLVTQALARLETGSPKQGLNAMKKEDYVVFHVTDLYSQVVYDAIISSLRNNKFMKYKILHIQQDSPLRIYDPASIPRYSWPSEGCYWEMERGKSAFCYTTGGWEYSAGKRYVIWPYSVTPIKVDYVKGSEGSSLNSGDLQHIYSLTRMHYYSGDIPRIKMPCTTRLGQRAAELASNGLQKQDFDVSYLY